MARADFIATPGNSCPAGGKAVILKAGDGVCLRAAHWPPSGVPRAQAIGTVFLLNGRTEFIDKYFEAVQRLIERRYQVFALDWRGQGLSDRLLPDPEKGHVGNFADYEGDLAAMLKWAVAEEAPRPFLVLAHSMGGHNALRFALSHDQAFDGLALCAPMLGVKLPGPRFPLQALVAVLSAIAPKAYALGQGPMRPSDTQFAGNLLCSDPRRFAVLTDSLAAEPQLRLGGVTNRWLDQAFTSMRFIHDRLAQFDRPMVIFSGLADRIVDSTSHRTATQIARQARLVAIAGANHEILREADRYQDQLWQGFDDWRAALAG